MVAHEVNSNGEARAAREHGYRAVELSAPTPVLLVPPVLPVLRGGCSDLQRARIFHILYSQEDIDPQMALGDLEQLVMLALMRLGDEGFGAAAQREIAERSGRYVTLGAVYTALNRLEEKGFVASRVGDPLPQRGGRRRRHYSVLPLGRRAIADAVRAMQALSSGLQGQLDG